MLRLLLKRLLLPLLLHLSLHTLSYLLFLHLPPYFTPPHPFPPPSPPPSPPPGIIIFAIGFADADYGELVSIASSPSDRHVFFVDDLDAFKMIEEKLVTFVCETATASG